jgi:hypothetical protein
MYFTFFRICFLYVFRIFLHLLLLCVSLGVEGRYALQDLVLPIASGGSTTEDPWTNDVIGSLRMELQQASGAINTLYDEVLSCARMRYSSW